MKRLICILMLSLLLAGCGKSSESDVVSKVNSRFVCVENNMYWEVMTDRETGVMYVMSCGAYNTGTFTLLVDADGNPLIYREVTE